MKKSRFLIALVCCLFFITSCTKQATPTTITNATGSNTENGDYPNSFLGIQLPNNKYGDFQQVSEPGYAKTDAGLYEISSIFPNSASIIYTDFATEQTIYLCNQPGCKHDTDACTSYIALQDDWPPSVAVTDNNLLLIRGAATEAANPYIEIRNLDGSDNRKLCEFPANQSFDIYKVSDNNYLFMTIREIDETGNAHYYLSEVNLSSGEIKQIMDATTESGYYQLVGSYKNHLILQENNFDTNIARQILVNPENPSFDQEIGTYELSGGYIFIMNNVFVRFDSKTDEVSTTNLDTGEDKTIQLESVDNQLSSQVFPAFDNYIFYNRNVPDADGNPIESRYLVDLSTGVMHPLSLKTTFKDYFWDVVGVYKDQLCVIYDFKEIPLVIENEQGDMETVESYVNMYGFISKADYIANTPKIRPAQTAI